MLKRWFLVGVILALVSLLTIGCVVPKEDYEAVIAELDVLKGEVASLHNDL